MLAVTLLAMSVAVVLAGEKVEPPTRAEKIADGVQKVVDAIANNVEDVATNVCSDNLADATQCDLFKDTLVAEIAKADADLAVIDENLRGVFLERVSDDAAKRDAVVDEIETLIDADEVDQTAIDAKIAEHADLVDEQTIDLQVRDTLFENDAAKKTARDAFLADFDAAVAASDARVAKLEKILQIGADLIFKIDEAEENEEDFDDRQALQDEAAKLLEEHEAEVAAIANLLPNGTQRFALAKKVFDARAAEAEVLLNEVEEQPVEELDFSLERNPIRLTHVVQDDLVDHTDLAATYPDVTYELIDESADKKRAEAAEPTYEANCASNLELEEDANELCKQQLAQFIGESESKFSTVLVLDGTDVFVAESTELEKVAKAAKWEPSWSAESAKEVESETDPYAKSSEDHNPHHAASEAEEEDSATLASLSLSLLSLVGLRSLF